MIGCKNCKKSCKYYGRHGILYHIKTKRKCFESYSGEEIMKLEENPVFVWALQPAECGCWVPSNKIFCLCGLHYLYIYKVGAFFDLLGRTPPRPLAFEGWNLDKLLYWPCRWLWLSQFWSSAIYRCHLLAIFTPFFSCEALSTKCYSVSKSSLMLLLCCGAV